jgi:hypothetical protein
MTEPDIQGVFNFDEDFPGPHMIRVRLRRRQAWDVMRQLAVILKDYDEVVDFTWFGTLRRDAEEDKGNPIEVE